MTINHYSPIQVYFRNDEVTFNGKAYVCIPNSGHSVIDRTPTDTRYWKLKQTPEEAKLAEIHELRCRQLHDHELLIPILRPVEWDEDFLKAVETEMFKRQRN